MTEETLRYPKQIASEIGLSANEISSMKRLGCRFYGRKTCVKWVREYLNEISDLAKEAGFSIVPPVRPQHSGVNTPDVRVVKSGLPGASPPPPLVRPGGIS